jgi:gliding-associated putative ABC transporter substrate-binding component GldG
MADDNQVSKKRQWVSGANAVTLAVAAVGIAFVANAIASQTSRLRIDLTEDNLYTLAGSSSKVVKNLESDVEVKAFISADMPKGRHRLRQRVDDLLAEYRAISGGDLTYQIYAPDSDQLSDERAKELEQEAKGYGCEKVGIGQSEEDKLSLRSVYKCVAFIQDGDTTEVIKDLRGGRRGNLEYEFTKTLMNLTTDETKTVGFVSGFGGPADGRRFEQQLDALVQQTTGDLMDVTTVDLSGKDPSVPENVSALVVLNPTKQFSDKAKFAIDAFVQRGGNVGWYQSATGIDRQKLRQLRRQMGRRAQLPDLRKPLEPKLQGLFSSYGVKLRKDLVLDRSHAKSGAVRTRQGRARVSYPATFTTTNIDQSLPFTRGFGTLAFPAPSSLEIQASAIDDSSVDVYEAVKTHETAVRRPGFQTDLNYRTLNEKQDSEEPGPFVLAAALQGDLPSHYADKQLPEGGSEKELETDSSASSRLFVIGQASFFQPDPRRAYGQRMARLGGQFFVSSLQWLVDLGDLAEIRGKSMPKFIDKVKQGTQRTIKFINIACVPAFFALIGIVMMYRRRRRRERLEWSKDE